MIIRVAVLFTILLGVQLRTQAQVFRAEMDVIDKDACYEDITVTWGVKGNEMAFLYNQKVLRFTKFKLSSEQQRVVNQLNSAHMGDYVMAKSDLDDIFILRILETGDGMVIFINNISDRRENYLFDHTSVKICETNVFKK